ncbi:MAG: 5-(carboxyamino)imidazole ribonucleotide synthase [Melioribacteraceae bacterium]
MNKRKCIGILGGGQLARMSAYQAYKLGFDIAILEKTKNSPAGQLTHNEFVGWVDDHKLIRLFAKDCDIVTLENEFVDYHHLEYLEKLGKKVFPSSKTISLIQDKFIQKKTLFKKGIPVPKFFEVTNKHTYKACAEAVGEKFVLKSRKLGYDGYGNALINNEADYIAAIDKLQTRHPKLLAEEFVSFDKELAVMVARTKKEIVCYPVVETIQKNHICHTVIAPADVDESIKEKVKEIAVQCVKAVNGIGIFGIELFLTTSGEILVNEMAPRPHNSGHYTIEACVTSQFENHIRAVMNLPLGSTELVKPAAVMVNLLGKTNGLAEPKNYNKALSNPDLHVHLYGKEETRKGRKMGHITLLGDSADELVKTAKKIEESIIY